MMAHQMLKLQKDVVSSTKTFRIKVMMYAFGC